MKDEINEIIAYLGTDLIHMCESYVGTLAVTAFVMNCQEKEYISAIDPTEKVSNRGSMLLYGRDRKGNLTSLSQKDLDYIDARVKIKAYPDPITDITRLSYVLTEYSPTKSIIIPTYLEGD